MYNPSKGGMVMQITSSENILGVLQAYNPWWQSGEVPQAFAKTYRRFAFYEAMRLLDHPDIRRTVVLTGARRVGKTVIQYQMIQSLLERGVDPSRIFFVSLDHPLLKLCDIGRLLENYHQNIYAGRDSYYFFDEVQYSQDWSGWLKMLYDSRPESHTVATGSASPVLLEGASESGLGRWATVSVPTLSFYEYCHLLQLPDLPALPRGVKPTGLVQLQKGALNNLFGSLAMLQSHYNRYILVGGFPELALSKDDFTAKQILRDDVVDKALKRDIPALYNVRNAAELERIFLYLCYCSSNIVAVDAIAKELGGVSTKTVNDYIAYLESAHLIYRSWPINLSGKQALKRRSKVYVADAAIRNAVLMHDNILSDSRELGIVVETSIYKHIAAFYYQNSTSIGYFRGGRGEKEIDIVVEFPMGGAHPPTGHILIEVKYRENPHLGKNEAIVEQSPEAAACIVITKNHDDYGVEEQHNGGILLYIPAYAFLYLLGHAEENGQRGVRP